ncbi:peptidylprolyl isomerase [Sphingobacterium yanglingense]|uniref:Peptidyl-prolyl cis-trans isomerase n=1 Tax=Sphingobacterium yanglingense TaxID=1437280 RepID=A0A4R6WDE5_9SPHI|nr:peptidylprolyl isomerase [Sphingobacterium yanglingense]TDQ75833.1 peptidyl-prolyl cis-trans isomerase B (cyclophilin B) [Sphingobacterium yanglingense]
MKRFLFSIFLGFFLVVTQAQKPQHYYVELKTGKGNILIQLYNETPKHRDNFKKLVNERYYDSLLFHRVIKNFMIQGGDPDSKKAADNAMLGNGGPDYKISSEIQEGLIHKKGALGAARDNNPAKQSSASQFYIVQGHRFTNDGLDSLERFRLNGNKLSALQREQYTTVGGAPHLDGNYTVFGQVISGLEAVDIIAGAKTNAQDRPIVNERMSARLLTRREAVNQDRILKGLKPKSGFITEFFDAFKSKKYSL